MVVGADKPVLQFHNLLEIRALRLNQPIEPGRVAKQHFLPLRR